MNKRTDTYTHHTEWNRTLDEKHEEEKMRAGVGGPTKIYKCDHLSQTKFLVLVLRMRFFFLFSIWLVLCHHVCHLSSYVLVMHFPIRCKIRFFRDLCAVVRVIFVGIPSAIWFRDRKKGLKTCPEFQRNEMCTAQRFFTHPHALTQFCCS